MTALVDERGELVGGWARRMRRLLLAAKERISAVSGGPGLTQFSAVQGSAGPRRRMSLKEDGNKEKKRPTKRKAKGGFALDPWWEQQRHVAVMPQLWDEPCTAGSWAHWACL